MAQRRSAALMFRHCSLGAYAAAAWIKNNLKKINQFKLETFLQAPEKKVVSDAEFVRVLFYFYLMGLFYHCNVGTLSESGSLGINTDC